MQQYASLPPPLLQGPGEGGRHANTILLRSTMQLGKYIETDFLLKLFENSNSYRLLLFTSLEGVLANDFLAPTPLYVLEPISSFPQLNPSSPQVCMLFPQHLPPLSIIAIEQK